MFIPLLSSKLICCTVSAELLGLCVGITCMLDDQIFYWNDEWFLLGGLLLGEVKNKLCKIPHTSTCNLFSERFGKLAAVLVLSEDRSVIPVPFQCLVDFCEEFECGLASVLQ